MSGEATSDPVEREEAEVAQRAVARVEPARVPRVEEPHILVADDLREQVMRLTSENRRLRAENERLREGRSHICTYDSDSE